MDVREKASRIKEQIADKSIKDSEIIQQITATPEVAHMVLPSESTLFLEAVLRNREAVVKKLAEMGADIHHRHRGSLISGNALNIAHTPAMADFLLAQGLEIEKNLLLSEPYCNPAVKAAFHNDADMVLYWLRKQKELFGADAAFIDALIHQTVNMAAMMNQSSMLACIMAEDELFEALKEMYAQEQEMDAIRLSLRSLAAISDAALADRKKALRGILNRRAGELFRQRRKKEDTV